MPQIFNSLCVPWDEKAEITDLVETTSALGKVGA